MTVPPSPAAAAAAAPTSLPDPPPDLARTVAEPGPLSARTLWAIALLTVAVRAAFMLVPARLRALPLAESPSTGNSPAMAPHAPCLVAQSPAPSDYVARHFPGMPVTLALFLRLGLPLAAASLAFQWLAAAAFAAAAAALYRDWRVGL